MGDEFLQSQGGNNNPYNQDNETSWLNWSRLHHHADIFRSFKEMIAFRKEHASLSRSRLWRDDIVWFGAPGPVDLSHKSNTLAFFLSGKSENYCDLYVAINASPNLMDFRIQCGSPRKWRKVIDTAADSPKDMMNNGPSETYLSDDIMVATHSIVVLADV